MNTNNNNQMARSVVVVRSTKRNAINGILSPVAFVITEWNVRGDNGDSTKQQFKDNDGQPMILRVPQTESGLEWDKSDPNHRHNIELLRKLLLQYPENFRGYIEMVDLDTAAQASAGMEELSAELKIRFRDAKRTNDNELLYGISRILIPGSERQTIDVVYAALLKIAQDKPIEVLQTLDNKDFKLKVEIRKLLAGNIIQETADGIYKIDGAVISSSMDGLELYLKENVDFYHNLLNKMNYPNQAMGVATRTQPQQLQEQSVSENNNNSAASVSKTEKVEDPDAPSINYISQIARQVKAGIFEKKDDGYFFNDVKVGHDNKSIAIFMLKNSSLKDQVEETYKEYKKQTS